MGISQMSSVLPWEDISYRSYFILPHKPERLDVLSGSLLPGDKDLLLWNGDLSPKICCANVQEAQCLLFSCNRKTAAVLQLP